MRKKIYLLLILASAVLSTNSQIIYSTDFSTREEFEKWTVLDWNSDGNSWVFNGDNEQGKRVYYSAHATNEADDVFISPAITPTINGNVIVHFNFSTSTGTEELMMLVGDTPNIDEMYPVTNFGEIHADTYSKHIIQNETTAGKPFYVGFYIHSDKNQGSLYLSDFTCEEKESLVDLKMVDILSPVSGSNLSAEEEVTVKVRNVGYCDNNTYPFEVFVDGEKVLEETGFFCTTVGSSDATYTLKGTIDLSKPRHLYEIKVAIAHPKDNNADNNAKSISVRHIAPATIPYSTSFEPSDYNDETKVFNLNNDSGIWTVANNTENDGTTRTGTGYIRFQSDANNTADDWLILEPLTVESGNYTLKFWYHGLDVTPEKFAVFYGNEATPEAMTNKIAEYNPFTSETYLESAKVISFDAPQTVYLGFHAFSDANAAGIAIDDLTFEKGGESGIKDAIIRDFICIDNDKISTSNSIVSSIYIYDACGRTVISATSGSVDLRTLAKGIYIVKVITNTGIYTTKIAR